MRTIITFIIVFGVIVIVHEFGHFFFAKKSGILVREFAIGMGPKLYGHQGKDGTTYTIRMLPVGGYVRMAGAEDDDVDLTPGMPIAVVLDSSNKIIKINTSKKVQLPNSIPLELTNHDLNDALTLSGYVNGDENQVMTYDVHHDATIIESDGTELRIAPRDVQFQSAKLWQRMLTNFAGPMNNFILAIILFIVVVFMQGGVIEDVNQLGSIQDNSPAAAAGLEAGDTILSINGEEMDTWTDITTIVSESPDKELDLIVERDGQELTITAIPEAVESSGTTIGRLGITVPMKTGFLDKIIAGITLAFVNSLAIFQALGRLITNFSLNQLGGPVRIFEMSSQAASQGMTTVIAFMAMLSVNLGIMNLLPIPALDGGKLVLNIFEGVRGKPLSQDKEGIITLIGVGCLLLLMILVTWNDIQRVLF